HPPRLPYAGAEPLGADGVVGGAHGFRQLLAALHLRHLRLGGLPRHDSRRRRPDAPGPYRTWGYPVVPALFIFACLLLIGNTLKESPRESLIGLGLVVLGIPAYVMFKRRSAA